VADLGPQQDWKLADVRASIEQSPRRSARKHADTLGLSDQSVRRILHRDLRMPQAGNAYVMIPGKCLERINIWKVAWVQVVMHPLSLFNPLMPTLVSHARTCKRSKNIMNSYLQDISRNRQKWTIPQLGHDLFLIISVHFISHLTT
jgi:hypothetical protein